MLNRIADVCEGTATDTRLETKKPFTTPNYPQNKMYLMIVSVYGDLSAVALTSGKWGPSRDKLH